MHIKEIRSMMVLILIAAYLILAVCDINEGRYRTGAVSVLFATVTWLIFL